MKITKVTVVLFALVLVFNCGSALPTPQETAEITEPETAEQPTTQVGDANTKPESNKPVADGADGNNDPKGETNKAAPVTCDTECQLNHQTTIIILICILVCIILLIVILFGCYFMKKLHGKALLTADNAEILRRGPTSRPNARPDTDYMEKKTETRLVEGDNPNESKVITTTTTKIVSKSVDNSV